MWSVDQPKDFDPSKPAPFAQLMWSPKDHRGTTTEITVYSVEEREHYVEMGYSLTAPDGVEVDPMGAVERELAQLNEDDRKLLMDSLALDRRKKLEAKLAHLSVEDLEKLTKRGPGRPKKA